MGLPIGQIETKRFPVVGERAPSSELADQAAWRLTVQGLVHEERTLDYRTFESMAHDTITFDIHCVTSWTRLDSTFTGLPLRQLLTPQPSARFVSFGAYSARSHHTSLPVDYALEHTWVVHEFEGESLAVEHGGPVRTVTPGKYFYKSIKWLKKITLLAEDRPGWWEANSSYHNNADPTTGDQRFTTGSIRPQQVERFLTADVYDKYRGRVLLGLDLRAWAPASRALSRLHLKNCDLSGVDLSGADLRGSNLSLSSLIGARLVGTDLSGSDLEGADFAHADLTGANLSGTALSATRFNAAQVSGARFDDSWGLVESEQRYLESQGVSLPS